LSSLFVDCFYKFNQQTSPPPSCNNNNNNNNNNSDSDIEKPTIYFRVVLILQIIMTETETPSQSSVAFGNNNNNNNNGNNSTKYNRTNPTTTIGSVVINNGPGGRRRRRRNNNKNNISNSYNNDSIINNNNNKQPKSKSPATGKNRPRNNKSKSPNRSSSSNNNRNDHHRHHHRHHHLGNNNNTITMTVIINRCDLWDSAVHFPLETWVQPNNTHHPGIHVEKYSFAPQIISSSTTTTTTTLSPTTDQRSVIIVRVPYQMEQVQIPSIANSNNYNSNVISVIDTAIPNPHDPTVVHDKYWAQRRRLFSRFDQGIQLDSEGWYSVTPELIADHVAHRVADLAMQYLVSQQQQHGIVILDAFCGCGGNAIAFGKLPSHIVSQVVCVDTDRSKLLKAAHNAALYDIPKDKLVFVECNSIFILKYCFNHGEFVLDQPTTTLPQYMPPPVMPTTHAGYQVGGLDMLPRHIDLAFLDPPWYV
jgi:trimethylguanosine synthase